MDKITYEGEQYFRTKSKWTDSRSIVVHQTLQIKLNRLYLESIDYSNYRAEDFVKEGDRFKASEDYGSAVFFYKKAIDLCDQKTLEYILPRITSCYRAYHCSRKAIELFSEAKKKYGVSFFNVALLTSVAAAYCDLLEYENALRCCRWAWKICDGNAGAELQSVFQRIKSESGLTIP